MKNYKILHEKGLKITTGRKAILDFLETEAHPSDANSILEKIRQNTDQETVYRILNTFYEKGIVQRIEIGEGKYRYELNKNHHHHLICAKCGSIEDVEGDFINDIESNIKNKKGFLVKSHSLEFFGICRNCQH